MFNDAINEKIVFTFKINEAKMFELVLTEKKVCIHL